MCPIGEEDTPTRRHADLLFKHIVEPAARECHYKVVRADKVSKPSIINIDVMEHLLEDPLVVADLSYDNPNVLYELAIRHAAQSGMQAPKPVIQMIEYGQRIPFHLAQCRTIKFGLDVGSASQAKSELVEYITAVEAHPTEFLNPFSAALSVLSMRNSENPLERTNAAILSGVHNLFSDLNTRFSYLESRLSRLANGLRERLESLKQTEQTIVKLTKETMIRPLEGSRTPEKLSHPSPRKPGNPPGPWLPSDDE